VKDTWAESWAGLDKETVIVNWYYEKRDVNLKWFADRGHKQILAGYYDSDPSRIITWLQSADKVPGVIGVMYTTWQHNFSDLEKFSKCVDEFVESKKK
jgi:predicted ATP-grasp superfamily ATP-dependent carboligase